MTNVTTELFTRDELKQNAIRNLRKINCYAPYRRAFEKKDSVITMYEGIGGYYITNDDENGTELLAKIKEVEEQYQGMVYAVIHNFTECGELYTMLWQTAYKEDDEWAVTGEGGYHICYAYVWNKTDEWCSEFGSVGIVERFGGLLRIS